MSQKKNIFSNESLDGLHSNEPMDFQALAAAVAANPSWEPIPALGATSNNNKSNEMDLNTWVALQQ